MHYDLFINDTIGWPISANYVRGQLKDLDPEVECSVYINSLGGSVSDGLDIRQQFVDHGNVTVYIHGMTASSASIIATGAKRIVMGRYSFLMVHKCSVWLDEWGQMNSNEIASTIRRLEKSEADLNTIDHVIASIYSARSSKSTEKMKEVMNAAMWLTADQALELGLIDEILDEDRPMGITDHLESRLQACGFPVPSSSAFRLEKSGFLSGLISEIKEVFRSSGSLPKNNINKMDKKFKHLSALLSMGEGAEGASVTASVVDDSSCDKGCSSVSGDLTSEQLSLLDERVSELLGRLSELDVQLKASEAKNSSLEAEVQSLRSADGASTNEVRPGEDVSGVLDGMSCAQKNYETLKGLF